MTAWSGGAGSAEWALLACVPALALAIDRVLGEPPLGWHPVAWMGRWLAWLGVRVAPPAGQERAHAFGRGALAWCASAGVVVLVAWALQRWILAQPAFLAALALALLLKPLLAWAMLHDEVLGVERALLDSTEAGRLQLARLVSRDVATLDGGQVRESAIETLAENLNDSLVAPLFWFVLLGLPGAALFRFANTADAMWGYRGVRAGRDWRRAGTWAARADDVLAWLPARLTALLIGLAGRLRGWSRLPSEAGRTPSPNGGWPMAAMGLVLGVRLGKPGVYGLNAAGRAPEGADLVRACAVASHVALAATVLACAAVLAAVVLS
ncbi:MAG TPA: adenosylcobinamide-phosphate synthase CbiB [Ottowia sp.]|uniref:adenosylcobinamide-phosphate synthase CbiB n=1 Tax=Ottowia sp. TaxID=1898956 RepID=UPI002CD34A95|nr:adenosylcobinamide-phosphate synthase CbiB [Ottowia sp.]HMN21954.1 adenosylcobinamide-phosphate synthase CbiB [Ottowia sp.]